MSLLPCQQGTVVTVRITTAQLTMLSTATRFFLDKSGVEGSAREELEALAAMSIETAIDPGEPGTVHGFAL